MKRMPSIFTERRFAMAVISVCLAGALWKADLLLRATWATASIAGRPELLRFAVLRTISDASTWLASAFLCWSFARVVWRMRGRISFGVTGYLLVIIVLGFGLKRLLDFDQLRLAINVMNPKLGEVSAAVSAIIAVGVLLLMPVVRNIIDIGLTASAEHEQFIAAAETNAHAFLILGPVCNKLGRIVDFRFLFLNERAEGILGAKRARLIDRRLARILPVVRSNGLFEHLVSVARTGVPYIGEVDAPDRRGHQHTYSLQFVKTASGVAVVMADLSDERLQQRQLADLHRFSQSIIENAPFSIVATDPNGKILAANAATEELTQYRKRELVGLHSLVTLHDAAELSARSVSLSESTGKPVLAGFQTLTTVLGSRKSDEREWTYLRKDGQKTPVHLALTALRGEENELTGYLAIAFDISERKKLTDSITYLAHHDVLTGLPNRASLQVKMDEAIERARREQTRLAVLMIDVDSFKRINDSLGHSGGDDLLVAMGERIRSAVRKSDFVARVGGDEFVVMLEDLNHNDGAQICADKILESINQEIPIADHLVHVTASIGICAYPDAGLDSTTLLRNADIAMYDVKGHGMNGVATYCDGVAPSNKNSLRVEQDLRRAIELGQMELYYQPQISCRSGKLTGVEALLRWNHPERGLLPPSEFINLAEDTGMIVPIGEWALKQGCKEIGELSRKYGTALRLAVNLSARQFRQQNLAQIVSHALDVSGLPAHDLELEITERILMGNSVETLSQLKRLRDLGTRIAIDDFGTGFSSFKYILDYNVDCLKIDRSFISKCPADPNATAIVRAIIAMAHGLSMRVVAEGIETPEQSAFLLRRHCDEAQGYLFDKPLPLKKLAHRMSTAPHSYLIGMVEDDALLAGRPQ